jgi:hypothetical protein
MARLDLAEGLLTTMLTFVGIKDGVNWPNPRFASGWAFMRTVSELRNSS